MASTDPLTKRIAEMKSYRITLRNALDALNRHMHEYDCVRDDLIRDVQQANDALKKAMGVGYDKVAP